MSDAALPGATTVLLLRPAGDELRVFLVKRNSKSRFMPSAWVFPGGRVDEADLALRPPYVTGGASVGARLRLAGDDVTGFLVAGVRETFEEAGIWLGRGDLPTELRHALNRGDVRFNDLLAEHEACVDLDRLYPWAWWVTPDNEPRRYNTRFVVAVTESDGVHDDGETVDSGWFTPTEALAAVARGDVRMAPPTWWTVCELQRLGTVAAVLAHTETRAIARVQPLLRLSEDEVHLTLPGHADHPDAAIDGLPTHIAFAQGRWWAH